MKKTAAFRIGAELCFYYSILSIFTALRPWTLPMALFASAGFAAAMVAVYCPWAALRLLIALLPGLCFLGAELRPPLFFPMLAWLYLILVLTRGRFHVWLDEYRRTYRLMLIFCLCALGANVVHNYINHGELLSFPCMIYALSFLCLGAAAMRIMQMNANMDLRWRLSNTLVVVGVPALAISAALGISYLLRFLKPAILFVLRPLGNLIAWLLRLLVLHDEELPELTPIPTLEPTPEPSDDGTALWAGAEYPGDVFDDTNYDPELGEKAALIIGYVALALLLLLAVYLVVRRALRSGGDEQTDDYLYDETEEDLTGRPRRAGGRSSAVGHAQQLRGIYRKYLVFMRENGIRVRKDSTSEEILGEAERVRLSLAAQRLRELYLKARYADGSEVTREDVQEAARCLTEIRGDKSWKQ